MLLGENECNYETAYFMKYGFYPKQERINCEYIPPNEDSFDLLNYLECNFETNTNGSYKRIKGYY